MNRGILTAFLGGVFLLAFAMVPPMLPGSTTMSLSGSAQAQKQPTSDAINLNSSRSNNYRDGTPSGTGTTVLPKQGNTQTPPKDGAAKTTTVKGSKSNTSD